MFDDKFLKIIICGVFFLVDDSVVFEMLLKLKVFFKIEMYYEKIRNFEIKKMISVLNGNCFLYIELILLNIYLFRNVYCVGLKCKFFY